MTGVVSLLFIKLSKKNIIRFGTVRSTSTPMRSIPMKSTCVKSIGHEINSHNINFPSDQLCISHA